LLQISGKFISGNVTVGILIDLFEDVDRFRTFLDVEKFDFEEKGGAAGDEITGTLWAIAKF
jgi:hypothetical protein